MSDAELVELLFLCAKKKYDETLEKFRESGCEELSLAEIMALINLYVLKDGHGSWKWPT